MTIISVESPVAYAAKLTVIFGDDIDLAFLKDGIDFDDKGVQIKVFELLTTQTEQAKHWTRARFVIGPLSTAEDAIQAGYRMTDTLLGFAVAQKISFSFEEPTQGRVVEVVDYQRAIGVEGRGEGRSVWPVTSSTFTELLAAMWGTRLVPLADHERVALGFYAAAEMEASAEAKFVLYVTSLESFCIQVTYPKQIEEALGRAASSVVSELGKDHPLAQSLSGGIKSLKRESVGQSFRRALGPLLSSAELKFVLAAYSCRSTLLHEGKAIPNIHQVNNCFKDVLRVIYSKHFGWEVRYPIHLEIPSMF